MKESETLQKLPLISIGIPTYNRPESLLRTLIEITAQSYKNLDIIVSDNASHTNETEIVVREFMRNDQRIRYFKQSENLGMNLNFQFVFEQALGEYFVWSSDDDWHSPEFVESLLAASLSGDCAVSFCNFDIRDEDGHPVLNYPDSYNALRLMTRNNSTLRQLGFFMLTEGRAIPHVIYGLLPMRDMKGFSWMEHLHRYGEYGADTLFVFWLLGKGRLALVECKLFGCTVNNQKHYTLERERSYSKALSMSAQRIGYLFSFVKISKGWTKLLLICVFPLKLGEVLFSMLIREPLPGVMRRLKRMKHDGK